MKSLADLLGRTLRDTGSARALEPVWARVVGELIAKHTHPARWEGKVLVVRCDAPSWRAALEPERASLTRKLAADLGESAITSLVFEVA